jgi:predicted enzyme related to lactoylglutathione lyase
MTPSIGNPVVHFEIGCKDLEGTTAFYTGLFGWTATSVPQASLLDTHSTGGVPGHITALGHEPRQYVTFYIQVDNITEVLPKIEAAGGKRVVGPIPLPDGKKFAWFTDPGGNMVGLVTKG